MSWSARTKEPFNPNVGPELDLDVTPQPAPEGAPWEEQFRSALVALLALSEAVGTDDDYFTVSISGHANPNHEQAEGWGDEFVSVTLSVVKPR